MYSTCLIVVDIERFFAGKNKVMKIALGTSAETEAQKDLHLLSEVFITIS